MRRHLHSTLSATSAHVAPSEFTGDATFRIPIVVAPGTGGLTPEVALEYNSAATRDSGPLGVGWSLDIGPSVIQRSTRDGAPAYDATDTFELAGSRLKPTGIPGRYVSENHDFTRIEHLVTTNSDSWRVLRPDGTRLYFGSAPGFIYYSGGFSYSGSLLANEEVRASDPTAASCPAPLAGCSSSNFETIVNRLIPFAWYLDRVEDRNGNVMRLQWGTTSGADFVDADPGMRYLTSITYSLHLPGAIGSVPGFGDTNLESFARTRVVNFIYENTRLDLQTQYRTGFARRVGQRLRRIESRVDGSLVRRYALTYEESPASARSRLVSVRERVTLLTSEIPLEYSFSYGNGGTPSGLNGTFWSGLDARWRLPGGLTYVSDGQDQGLRIVDVNSDGYPDVVQAVPGAGNTYLGGPDGFQLGAAPSWALPVNLKDQYGYTGAVFGDLNGDGRQDVLQRRIAITGTNESPDSCTGGGSNHRHEVGPTPNDPSSAVDANEAFINTGSGWDPDPADEAGIKYYQTDFQVILGSSLHSCPYEYLPTAERVIGAAGSFDQGVRLIDANGDGRDDLVYDRNLYGVHPAPGDKWWRTSERRAGTLMNSVGGLASGVFNAYHNSMVTRMDDTVTERQTKFVKLYDHPKWQVPAYFPSDSYSWSHLNTCKASNTLADGHSGKDRFADINTDGLPDILENIVSHGVPPAASVAHFRELVNNGYGWQFNQSNPNTTWLHYEVFDGGYSLQANTSNCSEEDASTAADWGTRLIDINGDGGPDRIGGTVQPGGNDDFRQSGLWGARLFGTGSAASIWHLTPEWNTPVGFSAASGLDTGARLADVNADGMVDILVSAGAYLNLGKSPDMLETVTTPGGAVTTIEYRPYSAFGTAPQVNPDVDGQRRYSQPRWVVSRITADPGAAFSQPAIVQDFVYYEPVYDIADRAFRGFGRVLALGPVVGPVRSATETTFHTSDALRGMPRQVVVASVSAAPGNPSSTLLRKTLYDYAHASGATPTPVVTFSDGSTGTLSSIGDTQTGYAFSAFAALMNGSSVSSQAFLAFPVRQTDEEYEGQASPAVTQTRRSFDLYGNVVEIARLGDPATSSDDITTTMSYAIADSVAGSGMLLADRPASIVVVGNASGVPVGTTLTRALEILYDGNSGNPLNQTIVRGNPTRVRQAWTNALGAPTVVQIDRTFDVYGNLIRADAPFDVNAPGSDRAFKSVLYDSASQTFPVQVTVGSTAGSQYNLTTSMAYELAGCGGPLGMGLPCRITSPNGQIETTTYDPWGREIASTGPNGGATSTLYYDADRGTANQRTESRVRWSATAPADPAQDSNAIVAVTFYDGFGRPLEERKSGIGSNVARRMTYYDAAGRAASISRWDFGSAPVASTFYDYDAIGRTLAETLPDGTLRAFAYGHREATTTTTIPGDGLVHRRTVRQDAHGRLSEVLEYASPAGAPARTTYTYDAFDQLVLVRDAIANDQSLCGSSSACAGQTHETNVFFDELGNRTRLVDPDSGTWISQYDARGLVGLTQDPRGKIQIFAYDPLGRLKTRTPTATGENGDVYTYGLDSQVPTELGRLISAADGAGTDSFQYDAAGNVSLHSRTLFARRFDFARSYDPLGRVVQTIYPDGEIATSHFDKGLLTRISSIGGAYSGDYVSSVTYDALDRPLNLGLGGSVSSPLATKVRQFDAISGRLVRMEGRVASQLVAEANYSIDGAGRVRSQTGNTLSVGSGVLQTFSMSYAYDGLDRIVQTPGASYIYNYDALGNIIEKDHQAPNDLGWASLVYDDPVRPHALKHAVATSGTRTLDYEYDSAGNVIHKTRTGFQGAAGQGAATVDFTYNSLGRMTVLAASNGGNATFSYAADGRRLSTRRGLTEIVALPEPGYEYNVIQQRVNKHFFVDGVRVASSARTWAAPSAALPPLLTWRAPNLPELPLGALGAGYGALGLLLVGVALRRRARETGRGTLALRLGSVGTLLVAAPALIASPCGVGPPPITPGLGMHDEPALFYLTDHLGSTILTIEDGGTARNRYYFLPFGDPGIASEGPSLRHRFTGEEILEGTGLYMLGARVYDPETGRFLEPDPIVPDAANPQSFNRYSYAYNSPLNLIDPTGYYSQGSGEPAPPPRGNAPSSSANYGFSSHGPGNLHLHHLPTDPASVRFMQELADVIARWAANPMPATHPSLSRRELADVTASWGRNPGSQRVLSDPLRQQAIRSYADSLAVEAQSGRITDLEALARVSDFAASFGTDAGTFVDDIGSTLARTSRANPATPLDNNIPPFGDRGFYSLFRDGGNQVRHFTGAFVAGGAFGSIGGPLANTSREIFGGGGFSTADILLGNSAALLGASVTSGGMPPSMVGPMIREVFGP